MHTKEAPPFHIWNEGDVHELVCSDAADLKDRIKFGIRRCDNLHCDWCADNRILQLLRT